MDTGTKRSSLPNISRGQQAEAKMKVATDKQTSRRLASLSNYELVNELKVTVVRLQNLEMELNGLELELDEVQKEIESYDKEIDECLDRLRDINEFVRSLNAGEVPTVPDVTLALADMNEERGEEENAIKYYEDVRGWKEEQFQTLYGKCAALKKEQIVLHKICIEICSIFHRKGVFEVVRRKITNFHPMSRH